MGARLFYPALKGKKTAPSDLLTRSMLASGASIGSGIRAQIRATIAPHGKQVMVKITGGGRGMKAIQAHMRYISRLGKDIAGGRGQSLELEDENGNRIEGAQSLKDLAQDWRMAGGHIDDDSKRREAYSIIPFRGGHGPEKGCLNSLSSLPKPTGSSTWGRKAAARAAAWCWPARLSSW